MLEGETRAKDDPTYTKINSRITNDAGSCTECHQIIVPGDRIYQTTGHWCPDINCVCPPKHTAAYGDPIPEIKKKIKEEEKPEYQMLRTKLSPSNDHCLECGLIFGKGERLFSKFGHCWCKDADCVNPLKLIPSYGDSIPETKKRIKEAEKAQIPDRIKEMHKAAWDFALDEAYLVFPDLDQKPDRIKLAQTFYKKSYEHVIFGDGL